MNKKLTDQYPDRKYRRDNQTRRMRGGGGEGGEERVMGVSEVMSRQREKQNEHAILRKGTKPRDKT